MKKMKKVLAVALSLVMAGSLAACRQLIHRDKGT